MDESLLPPPVEPARPFPWRLILALFVPAAALAGGTGLQRWLDPAASDPVLRWLAWSTAFGLAVGALVGLALRRRLVWAAYGVAAPWIAAGAVAAVTGVVRPVGELLADHREAACRAEGRSICSLSEFDAACARRDVARLGPPHQSICAGASCTQRWVYRGPFRPEEPGFKGGLLCSIVDGSRSSMIAVADP
ncbi:MAG: hypothetical protein ABR567_00080 [Myxococcales bacterium]|nr:hypothetical protein [Myxococcales bacterium]